VAFQEQDIERLLGQLHTYYRQQLGETLDEPKAYPWKRTPSC
jgi:hypothetical protein